MNSGNLQLQISKSSLLVALSLLILFPLFNISGTGSLFIVAVVLHVLCLSALVGFSISYILQLFSSKISAVLMLILPLLLIVPDLVLPITYKDSLIHHLFVPLQWMQLGSPTEIAWHSWSYYPMAVQTVFIALLPYAEQLCSLYHALYLFPLAAVSAILFTSVSDNKTQAVLTTSLILFTPVCLQLAGTAMVDLPLAFFCTSALSLLFTSNSTARLAVYIGLLLAASLSTKYNGLVFAVCFMPVAWAGCSSAVNFRQRLQFIGIISFTALVLYSPWPLRNLYLTNNPFYPLFNSFFPVDQGNWENLPSLGAWQQRVFIYQESLLQLILVPVRMIFFGAEGNPRAFDGVATPLLILGLLPLLFGQLSRKVKLLYLLCFLYLATSLYLGPARVRYIAPIFGALAVVATIGAAKLGTWLKGRTAIVFSILLLVQISWGFYHQFKPEKYKQAYSYLVGDLSRTAYLSPQHREFDLVEQVNQRLDKHDCVYALYTANTFYWYSGCVESDGYHPARRLITWIKRSNSAEELNKKLNQAGFSHLFFHEGRLSRVLAANLAPDKVDLWQQYISGYTKVEFSSRGYQFLTLKE